MKNASHFCTGSTGSTTTSFQTWTKEPEVNIDSFFWFSLLLSAIVLRFIISLAVNISLCRPQNTSAGVTLFSDSWYRWWLSWSPTSLIDQSSYIGSIGIHTIQTLRNWWSLTLHLNHQNSLGQITNAYPHRHLRLSLDVDLGVTVVCLWKVSLLVVLVSDFRDEVFNSSS